MWLVIRGCVLNRNRNLFLSNESRGNKINLRGHEVINNNEIDGSKVFLKLLHFLKFILLKQSLSPSLMQSIKLPPSLCLFLNIFF